MAGYLQVSSGIAARVAAGMLACGDGLPSIRQSAQQYDSTVTTIGRAWRHLANAGVIEIPALRLAGSDDPGLDIALRRAGAAVVTVGARGSFHGLTRIWRGTADAAAIHLRHRCGDGNNPFARSLLRGRQPAIIRLWRREQGLLVPPGHPRPASAARAVGGACGSPAGRSAPGHGRQGCQGHAGVDERRICRGGDGEPGRDSCLLAGHRDGPGAGEQKRPARRGAAAHPDSRGL